MNERDREAAKKAKRNSKIIEPPSNITEAVLTKSADVVSQALPNEKYSEQVKDYTQYIIGRKISKNVPTFSEQEIEEGDLTIKNPAVLRILTKWCE